MAYVADRSLRVRDVDVTDDDSQRIVLNFVHSATYIVRVQAMPLHAEKHHYRAQRREGGMDGT